MPVQPLTLAEYTREEAEAEELERLKRFNAHTRREYALCLTCKKKPAKRARRLVGKATRAWFCSRKCAAIWAVRFLDRAFQKSPEVKGQR